MVKKVINPVSELSKSWQIFFERFKEIDTIKVSQWKEAHVLAYICQRFEKVFGKKFSITIKSSPTKSPDVYIIKQIMAMLGTSNMRTVKEYIDWVYDNKIIPRHTRFRKVGFFIASGFVNEFQFAREHNSQIKRSTQLPNDYKKVASALGISASTYGDLAFIKMAADQSASGPYNVLFANLEAMGFDLNILKEISE